MCLRWINKTLLLYYYMKTSVTSSLSKPKSDRFGNNQKVISLVYIHVVWHWHALIQNCYLKQLFSTWGGFRVSETAITTFNLTLLVRIFLEENSGCGAVCARACKLTPVKNIRERLLCESWPICNGFDWRVVNFDRFVCLFWPIRLDFHLTDLQNQLAEMSNLFIDL